MLGTIFPIEMLIVGVMYHSIHLLRDSLHVSERDYVTHHAFAASSKLPLHLRIFMPTTGILFVSNNAQWH